jgi:hypothetical protein
VQEYTDIARCRLDDIEVVAAAATATHSSTAASLAKQQQQLFTSAHSTSSSSTALSAEATEAAAEAEGILRYVRNDSANYTCTSSANITIFNVVVAAECAFSLHGKLTYTAAIEQFKHRLRCAHVVVVFQGHALMYLCLSMCACVCHCDSRTHRAFSKGATTPKAAKSLYIFDKPKWAAVKAVLLSTADIIATQKIDAVAAIADNTISSSSSDSSSSDAFSLAARMKLAKTLVQDTFVSAKVSTVHSIPIISGVCLITC